MHREPRMVSEAEHLARCTVLRSQITRAECRATELGAQIHKWKVVNFVLVVALVVMTVVSVLT